MCKIGSAQSTLLHDRGRARVVRNHRYRSATLQTAVRGLLAALEGWRGVATHLKRLPEYMGSRVVESIMLGIPPDLQSAWEPNSADRWMPDPTRLQRGCEEGERTLRILKTDTPSERLLADDALNPGRGRCDPCWPLAVRQ